MSIHEIIGFASALSTAERRQLVRELLDSFPLDDEVFGLHPEWIAEAQRRAAELDAGSALSVSWDEIRRDAMERISNHVAP